MHACSPTAFDPHTKCLGQFFYMRYCRGSDRFRRCSTRYGPARGRGFLYAAPAGPTPLSIPRRARGPPLRHTAAHEQGHLPWTALERRATPSVRLPAGGAAAEPDGVSVAGRRAPPGAWCSAHSAALVLLLAVWVVNRTPAINWIAWLIAAPAFVLSMLSVSTQNQTLLVWSSLLEAALYFYAAGSLIVYMLQRPPRHQRRAVRRRRHLHPAGLGLRLPLSRLPVLVSGQLHRRHRAGAAADVAGAAVPELHQPVRGRPGRRPAAQRAGARAGDAGAVRRRGLYRHRGLAPDRPVALARRTALMTR